MNDDKKRIKKQKRVWGMQAKSYDKISMSVYEDAYRLSIKKIIEILASQQNVLEIGCGTGIITFGIADLVQNITAQSGIAEMARKSEISIPAPMVVL